MAELVFYYGTMNSGKSIDLQKVAHNYNEGGKEVLIFTSSLDNRFGTGVVASRIGIQREAIPLSKDSDVREIVIPLLLNKRYSCILIDEVNFLTKKQVLDFANIVDEFNIPVLAYGLKNDFQNKPFEGSLAMLMYADRIEEIPTICMLCENKAIMNLRINNGKPVYDGEQIQVGANESYIPVCRKCYNNPDLDKLKNWGR